MVNTNLVDDDGLVYYLIKKDGRDVCQVFGKHTAKAIVTELNSLHGENEQLKSICQDHRDHAIDFKADCVRLEKENEQLKQQISYYEKLITDKEVEWLRDNTVWEQMPSSKRTVTKTSK